MKVKCQLVSFDSYTINKMKKDNSFYTYIEVKEEEINNSDLESNNDKNQSQDNNLL